MGSHHRYGCTESGQCVDPDDTDTLQAMCAGKDLAASFGKVASIEGSDSVGYQYFGDHGSGLLVQWPETTFCQNAGTAREAGPVHLRPHIVAL